MLRHLKSLINGRKTLLDAGAGSGFYSQWAVARGLQVTAIDKSYNNKSPSDKRCSDKRYSDKSCDTNNSNPHATDCPTDYLCLHADLMQPLPLADNSFELIVCALVLQQVSLLEPCLHEFKRVLTNSGKLIISVPHPFETMSLTRNYFELVDTRPQAANRRYHRSFSRYLQAFWQTGFVLQDIDEPQPTVMLEQHASEMYHDLKQKPGLVIFILGCST